MIEKLRRIQVELGGKEILTWDDVEKAFYGRDQVYRPGCLNVGFGALIDSNLQEIITGVEKNSNLKYFPIYSQFSKNQKAWDDGEECFGFTHPSVSNPYPFIHGRKPITAGFLPEDVTLELDPTKADHMERMDRIEFGGATNNPYTYLLFLDAEDINPRRFFTDAFYGLLNLLGYLEEQKRPWWFYLPIKDHPNGIRFS
jgi:hypothetical protein